MVFENVYHNPLHVLRAEEGVANLRGLCESRGFCVSRVGFVWVAWVFISLVQFF